jgi:hypothetical protein
MKIYVEALEKKNRSRKMRRKKWALLEPERPDGRPTACFPRVASGPQLAPGPLREHRAAVVPPGATIDGQ